MNHDRRWRRDPRHQRDRIVFAFVAAFGSAGIVALMAIHAGTAIVVMWSMVVLVVYGVTLWASPRFQVSEQQAGDATNYLGFILGLVMLSFSLWEHGVGRSERESVFNAFAAALASIATGVVLKVLFHQFRDDPEEIEEAVRAELAEASRELHLQMIRVLQDLSTMRAMLADEMARPIGNVFTTLAERTQAALERLLVAHVATVTGVTERQYEREGAGRPRLQATAAELDALAAKLAETADEIRTLIRSEQVEH